ncbi:hypothetical protein BKA70DRAFT_1279028 [Coprinopsis sp. MPI-PUGE-AT-0042]|nr:hypothetical protein BKA70DRAFT_1279028 [Coprinopsis sp. MPI-PUGE-AT-0042]
MVQEQITLYTAKICPWAHRTELALQESGLDYQRYEIDLANKPEWYAPKVNPASKVPAIAYGGPKSSPEDPSPESVKLAESYVLLEFIADISGKLLPSDPVLRAKARFFVESVTSIVGIKFYTIAMRGTEDPSTWLAGIEVLQGLLPKEGGFAIGEYSIADAAITPFLVRANTVFSNDIGVYGEGLGKKLYDTLQNDPKYARYRQYFKDITERESLKTTYHEQVIKDWFEKKGIEAREQKNQ